MSDEQKMAPVKAHLKVKKAPVSKRLLRMFLGTIDFDSMGNELVDKIAMPSIKTMLYDMAEAASRNIFLGEQIRGGGLNSKSKSSFESTNNRQYNKISNNRQTLSEQQAQSRIYRAYPREVSVEGYASRMLAEDALDFIREQIRTIGNCRVAAHFERNGIPTEPRDWAFGWYSADGMYVTSDKNGGWALILPTPKYIN